MDFKPIKTKKISGEIIEQIKNLIAEGQLLPGDRLLSERELSERLRVSRASVREALSALEMMGLTEARPGGGTFLKKLSVEDTIEPLSLFLLMGKDSYNEILEVRKILEVSGARLAAQRRTAVESARMQKAIQQMEDDLANNVLGEVADASFHYAIALATHNTLLIRLMNTIADAMHDNLRENREKLFKSTHTPRRLLNEHMEIYQAIVDQNGDLAANLMFAHLDLVQREMSENV